MGKSDDEGSKKGESAMNPLTAEQRQLVERKRTYAKQLLESRVVDTDESSKVYIFSQRVDVDASSSQSQSQIAGGFFIENEPASTIKKNVIEFEKDEEDSDDEIFNDDTGVWKASRKRTRRRVQPCTMSRSSGSTQDPEAVVLSQLTQPIPEDGSCQPVCDECGRVFVSSFLLANFDVQVCDLCRDPKNLHALITRTTSKERYILNDTDLDKREPPLRYILKPNPHNETWGDMRLYLEAQIADRAAEIWGGAEKIEAERERRYARKESIKTKQYERKVKKLRQEVRSSLGRQTKKTHEHIFEGNGEYDAEDDVYINKCKECGYEQRYETM